MSFLKNIFGNKKETVKTYQDFWTWFQANEQTFHNIIKNGKNPEKDFFDKLSQKLGELNLAFTF